MENLVNQHILARSRYFSPHSDKGATLSCDNEHLSFSMICNIIFSSARSHFFFCTFSTRTHGVKFPKTYKWKTCSQTFWCLQHVAQLKKKTRQCMWIIFVRSSHWTSLLILDAGSWDSGTSDAKIKRGDARG
jgi:hypothetical protein